MYTYKLLIFTYVIYSQAPHHCGTFFPIDFTGEFSGYDGGFWKEYIGEPGNIVNE